LSDLREIAREVAAGIPGCRTNTLGLVFERRSLPARVIFSGVDTDILVDTGELAPASLTVVTAGLWHDLKGLFGRRDFEVGDPEFDRTFELSTSEEGFARKVLTEAVRGVLWSLRLEFVWRFSRSGFLLRVRALPRTASDLDRWLVAAFQLLDALPGIDGVGQVRLAAVQERLDEEASCQVCGTALAAGAVVRCAKCRTPHHRDCWEFNGRCSTFACGESRFR
jgi:hypothetical protein